MARETSKKQEQLSLPELEALPFPSERVKAVAADVVSPITAAPEDETDASAKRRKPAAPRRARTRMVLVSDKLAAETVEPAGEAMAEETVAAPATAVTATPSAEPAANPLPASPPATLAQGTAASVQDARLKRTAYLATVTAAAVAIVVLIAGASQFADTQRAQRASIVLHDETLRLERDSRQAETHAKAVELFMKYNELMLQLNAPLPKGAKRETRYWKENLALGLLDALANLTRGNREWENTIAWALERHVRFIRDQRAACSAYSDEFVRLLEKAASAKASTICRDSVQAD